MPPTLYNIPLSLSYLPSPRPRRVGVHPEGIDHPGATPPVAILRTSLFTILVACTANICRSPLAAFSLEQRLGRADPDGSIIVTSAGTRARDGDRICSRVAEVLTSDEAGRRFVDRHSSRRVTEELIAGADLILLPDLVNRTRIALVDPLARRRAFTLREADRLLGALAATDLPSLPEVVATMHAERNRPLPDQVTGSWFSRRSRADTGPDIQDGHNLGHRQHRQTVQEVGDRASTIAAVLERSALA